MTNRETRRKYFKKAKKYLNMAWKQWNDEQSKQQPYINQSKLTYGSYDKTV